MWKSKLYGAFVLNRRVVLHAIDATPARWRGGAGSSPLDGAGTAVRSVGCGVLDVGRGEGAVGRGVVGRRVGGVDGRSVGSAATKTAAEIEKNAKWAI